MPATTAEAERSYDDDHEVFRTGQSKVVRGYFEPGQFISIHVPDSDVTVVVQAGDGVARDGERTHEVGPGSVVTVPAGQKRGVRAEGDRLEAVLVTAPPPTGAGHDSVRRGLQRGEFEPALEE